MLNTLKVYDLESLVTDRIPRVLLVLIARFEIFKMTKNIFFQAK